MKKTSTRLLAGMLCALAGCCHAAETFGDVPQGHWAFDEVHWLRADGMIEGWGGEFHGDRDFTRYEMATVLSRYSKKYEKEKARVEGELSNLRQEDDRQRAQLATLSRRTDTLEARMASLDGAAAPALRRAAPPIAPPPAAPPPAAPPPAPPPASAGGGAAAAPDLAPVDDQQVAAALERRVAEDTGMVAPLDVAPELPVAEDPFRDSPAAAPEANTEDPAGLSLRERIARLRARMRSRREEREQPSGGDASGGLREEVEDLAGPVSTAPGGAGGPPGEDPAPAAPPAPAPPPAGRVEASRSADVGGLDAASQDRYDAIRERYRRLLQRMPATSTPAPAPAERVVVPGIDAVGASPEGLPASQQPLPGVAPADEAATQQFLPGIAPRGGSAPADPGASAQPLPGLSSAEDQLDELELPAVGLGYQDSAGID